MGKQPYSHRRGGRSGGNGNQNRNRNGKNNSNKQPTKVEYKFAPNTAGKVGWASFALIKEKILHECSSMTHNMDIQKEIEDMEKYVIPPAELQISELEDKKAAKLEDQSFAEAYKIDYKHVSERKLVLANNRIKACTMILTKFCSDSMCSQLQREKDTYTDTYCKEPVALLERCKELSLDSSTTTYPFILLEKTIRAFFEATQEEEESAANWGQRVRDNYLAMEKLLGPNWLDHYIENLAEYKDGDTAKQDEMKKCAGDYLQSLHTVQSSFHPKFSNMKSSMRNRYAMSQDEYPRTLDKAINVVHTTKFNDNYKTPRQRRQHQKNDKDKKDPETEANGQSHAQRESNNDIVCFCCGKPGHKVPQCPDKEKIPRNEWFIKRVQAFTDGAPQDTSSNADAASSRSGPTQSEGSRRTTSWSQGTQAFTENAGTNGKQSSWDEYQQFLEFKARKGGFQGFQKVTDNNSNQFYGLCLTNTDIQQIDELIENPESGMVHTSVPAGTILTLDTGSTFMATLMDDTLCHDVRETDDPVYMRTNTGTGALKFMGKIPGMDGWAFIHPESVANLIGFSHMADRYHIWYDNWVTDAFFIDTPAGVTGMDHDCTNMSYPKNS